VARRIQHDIADAGWPVGRLLGSQSDLIARYGVSRAALREAVRLVEYLGVAQMQRGPGGGLLVSEPGPYAVVTSVIVFLTYAQVRLDDVLQARHSIEVSAAQLAAERATPDDVAALRQLIEAERREGVAGPVALHSMVARVTRNPALELFVDSLGAIIAQYHATARSRSVSRRERPSEAIAAHTALVDAIAEGNAERAGARMARHLDAIGAFTTTAQLERRLSIDPARGTGGKRGVQVSRQMFSDVVARGWPVGEILGSENDLMSKYSVSRAALREAIRLLEFHRIVRTRRGPGGGVVVAAPDGAATSAAMAAYLESRGISSQHLLEFATHSSCRRSTWPPRTSTRSRRPRWKRRFDRSRQRRPCT
jgi:DNA-binding FadR family transcriptional regulator